MIFDSHTHLNAEQFNEEIPETIARAHELGVTKMAVVGFDQPTIEKSLGYTVSLDGTQQKRDLTQKRLRHSSKSA